MSSRPSNTNNSSDPTTKILNHALMPATEPPLRYALLLYPQFEVLDAFGPLEALNTLPRLRTFPHASTLDFAIVAETLDPVTSGPVKGDPAPFNPKIAQSVLPTHTFENAPEVDVLIVPGGFGAGPMTNSGFRPNVQGVIGYIARVYPNLQYLISEFLILFLHCLEGKGVGG